jgi:CheY-like chemotaxis protein
MSDLPAGSPGSAPNVYFIDDSATMREVVKIACRRESFNVIACADVASAIAQFEQTPPDAIISDVIMPDRDGYQLCEYVKRHSAFGVTPVILLSGIVNREVADKAHHVGADELMRKPFHPQELVACVKKLLKRGTPLAETALGSTPAASAPNPLGVLFGVPVLIPSHTALSAPSSPRIASIAPTSSPKPSTPPKPVVTPTAPSSPELVRLRTEVQRLESLVKKLQSQLDTEREYCASLESQLRNLSTTE